MLNNIEYILCSANWYNDSKVHEHQPINIETGFVTTGIRHCNCIQIFSMIQKYVDRSDTVELMNKSTQGFLTNKNRFVDRTEAAKIAFNASQIKKEILKLHSEDLY